MRASTRAYSRRLAAEHAQRACSLRAGRTVPGSAEPGTCSREETRSETSCALRRATRAARGRAPRHARARARDLADVSDARYVLLAALTSRYVERAAR